jgi:hypothetical protein
MLAFLLCGAAATLVLLLLIAYALVPTVVQAVVTLTQLTALFYMAYACWVLHSLGRRKD